MTCAPGAGRRLLVAVLLCTLGAGLTACSKTGLARRAPSPDATSAAGSSATPLAAVASGRAEHARADAVDAMKALRSYGFSASVHLGADETEVLGRVVLPTNLTYTITKRATREQVIRIGGTTYIRLVPGSWKKLAHPSPADSPLQGLLTALNVARDLKLDPAGAQLTGTITAPDATHARLVSAGNVTEPVRVTFRLDHTHRVTAFTLATTLITSSRQLPLTELTAYGTFNTAATITAP